MIERVLDCLSISCHTRIMMSRTMPLELRGGETLRAVVELPDASPAAGDTLRYEFAAPTALAVDGVPDGGGWVVTVQPTITSSWGTGVVGYAGYVTRASGRVECVDEGTIRVRAAPTFSSWARAALAAVEDVIAGRATSDEATMQIGEISVSRMRVDELLRLRDWLRGQVARDSGTALPRRIHARFL